MIIIAIDPGSTSTKLGILKDSFLKKHSISHDRKEIDACSSIYEQRGFRFNLIKRFVDSELSSTEKPDIIVGRGGLIKPIKGGVYRVNDRMVEDLKIGVMGQHAANLGGIIAKQFADFYCCEAVITDPPVIDEMHQLARVSGLDGVERKSMFHALNQKATARKVSKRLGRKYEDLNLIVAHLGGGISVGIHRKGEVIDVNNALDGDGPFSPERSGSLPVDGVIDLIKSGKYTPDELRAVVSRKGGLYSYINSINMKEIEERIANGDQKCKLYYDAMAYQVAKEIGALATVVNGEIDAIVLTGGLAFSERFVSIISDRVKFIGKVIVEAGENEIEALIDAGKRILTGEDVMKEYI